MLLKRNNVDWLADTFRAVSNPQNPRYGQFLTRDEIAAKLRPDQKVFDDIAEWLAPFKSAVTVTEYSSSIKIVTTVAVARRLLNVPFSFYKHPKVAAPVLRIAGEATLPGHIFEHVELVVGISEFIQVRTCAVAITQSLLRTSLTLCATTSTLAPRAVATSLVTSS